MKLRNKKTGEIRDFIINKDKIQTASAIDCWEYNSLAELNEEWEDIPEEPKKHYEILAMGAVMECKDTEDEVFRNQGQREIGNYFGTKEEAEKAVEKLKAWKRLKDNEFRFEEYSFASYGVTPAKIKIEATIKDISDTKNQYAKDLMLLFGGKE